MVGLLTAEGAMFMVVPRAWYSASSRFIFSMSSILMGGSAALHCLLVRRSMGLCCRGVQSCLCLSLESMFMLRHGGGDESSRVVWQTGRMLEWWMF